MRTLLLTVLVSFNLVACVAGDNDADGQEIDGIAETQVDDMTMDVGMAEHQVKTAQQGMDVELSTRPVRQNSLKEAASQEQLDGDMAKTRMQQELSTRPVDRKNKYQEASSQEMLDGEMTQAQLELEKLGRDVDAEQEELYNPNRIEQVDMVELLRGIGQHR